MKGFKISKQNQPLNFFVSPLPGGQYLWEAGDSCPPLGTGTGSLGTAAAIALCSPLGTHLRSVWRICTGWIVPITAGSQLQNDEFSKTFQASTIHHGSDRNIRLFKIRHCYSHISKSFPISMQGSAEYLNLKEERHKACYSCQGKAGSVCVQET